MPANTSTRRLHKNPTLVPKRSVRYRFKSMSNNTRKSNRCRFWKTRGGSLDLTLKYNEKGCLFCSPENISLCKKLKQTEYRIANDPHFITERVHKNCREHCIKGMSLKNKFIKCTIDKQIRDFEVQDLIDGDGDGDGDMTELRELSCKQMCQKILVSLINYGSSDIYVNALRALPTLLELWDEYNLLKITHGGKARDVRMKAVRYAGCAHKDAKALWNKLESIQEKTIEEGPSRRCPNGYSVRIQMTETIEVYIIADKHNSVSLIQTEVLNNGNNVKQEMWWLDGTKYTITTKVCQDKSRDNGNQQRMKSAKGIRKSSAMKN